MVAQCVSVLVAAYMFTVYFWKITNAKESGPYNVTLDRLDNCEDKGSGEMSMSSTARKGEDGETYHTGELNMPYGLNDGKFKASGDASIWKDGQWRPIGLVWKMGFPKACSSTKQMVPVWFDILKAAGVQSTDCPIPKGNYHFKKYHVGPKLRRMSELKYGKYRIRMEFVRGGKKIGCIAYYARAYPSTS